VNLLRRCLRTSTSLRTRVAIAAALSAAAVIAMFAVGTSVLVARNDSAQLDRRLDTIIESSVYAGSIRDPRRGPAITARSPTTGEVVFQRGLPLPPLPDDAAARLKAAIPFASTLNPIDVTGQVFSQPAVLVQALRDAATCGRYRHVAAFLAAAGNAPGVWPLLQECIVQLRATPGAAQLVLSGILTAEQQAWLEAQGCGVHAEPAHAVEAVAQSRA